MGYKLRLEIRSRQMWHGYASRTMLFAQLLHATCPQGNCRGACSPKLKFIMHISHSSGSRSSCLTTLVTTGGGAAGGGSSTVSLTTMTGISGWITCGGPCGTSMAGSALGGCTSAETSAEISDGGCVVPCHSTRLSNRTLLESVRKLLNHF